MGTEGPRRHSWLLGVLDDKGFVLTLGNALSVTICTGKLKGKKDDVFELVTREIKIRDAHDHRRTHELLFGTTVAPSHILHWKQAIKTHTHSLSLSLSLARVRVTSNSVEHLHM